MRTTSSEPGSVPTKRACVIASAMFSMAAPAESVLGSERNQEKQINKILIHLLHKKATHEIHKLKQLFIN